MTKTSIALVVLVALAMSAFAPSLVVRAQTFTRFEYARVTSFGRHIPTGPNSVESRSGYKACVAAVSEWVCRDFEPTESTSAALRTALATLGNEGWELVSAPSVDLNSPQGATYLFKRQVR